MRRNIVPLIGLLSLCILSHPWMLRGEIYHVNPGHPRSSDENPGHEALPWRTLAHAGATAQAGDTVRIKAGVYRETLTVSNEGRLSHRTGGRYRLRLPERIVFEAYGDDTVIIDGSETVPPDQWQPVDGETDVYVVALDALLETWGIPRQQILRAIDFDAPRHGGMDIVFWNDAKLPRHLGRDENLVLRPMRPTADAKPSWEYEEETGLLYVHLGGADPRRDGPIDIAVRAGGIDVINLRYITVRRLSVRRTRGVAISLRGSEQIVVEDCQVFQSAAGINGTNSREGLIRRNRVQDVAGNAYYFGGSRGSQLYDNIACRYGLAAKSYNRTGFVTKRGEFNEFYHNIAVGYPEAGQGGFWPDVAGSKGELYVGNAAVRANFYIEAPIAHNLVQWNTVWRYPHQGIYLRVNMGTTIKENLVMNCAIGLNLGGLEDRFVTSGNLFTGNWLKQNHSAFNIAPAFGTHAQEQTFFQGNVYEIPPTGLAGRWAGKGPYKTVEAFRAATGQETLGTQVEAIDLDELGLVWVRLDGWDESHEPIMLFGNPDFERWGIHQGTGRFFWRRGDAEGSDAFPDEWESSPREMPRVQGWRPESRGHRNEQTGITQWMEIPKAEGIPVGGRVYHVASMRDTALSARGKGLWSPSLPVVGGAVIDLAVWMKIEGIEPVAEDGGAVVYVEWSDWTGQNRSREYLVGGEAGSPIRHPEVQRGTRDWSRVSGSVTAPDAARRFALYLGLRSAHGQVLYGRVDEIRTRAGEPPEDTPDSHVEKDAPLFDPQALEFSIVDLAPFVNRALADEVADDGKGGWTDQGPGFDMAGLQTGRLEHEGVPYHILTPQSCIVLESAHRRQSALPDAVDIPVGEKADVLYLLHSGAWAHAARWNYKLIYEDGTTFDIPVVGGANMRDWAQAGAPFDFVRTDSMRTTVWPDIVGNLLSPDCGLFVLEHRNPHPDRIIRAIRFEQDEHKRNVPILLNVTLGRIRE